ncbi:unnamed protein product [Acanthoscelides obtectus]|uniref:Uncharacterized protein n=1 Tax=Acanthoscelides obtectus TaxID=200917 RepID=A0A9P0QEA5_ACAOB|nr:unnamed protein product [Acanthoscelides obtectus]CAH2017847.1 unnamed protein product [Acanthoscelides obtectus]CAH2018481.1 unnamed protein product [Acanthoscelides obtectus]CAH2018505.1 unnamed protein product [Acanthoscelides obtectus]CAH2018817.1 unnamed protein product [Acanthoscelides obtectus]
MPRQLTRPRTTRLLVGKIWETVSASEPDRPIWASAVAL